MLRPIPFLDRVQTEKVEESFKVPTGKDEEDLKREKTVLVRSPMPIHSFLVNMALLEKSVAATLQEREISPMYVAVFPVYKKVWTRDGVPDIKDAKRFLATHRERIFCPVGSAAAERLYAGKKDSPSGILFDISHQYLGLYGAMSISSGEDFKGTDPLYGIQKDFKFLVSKDMAVREDDRTAGFTYMTDAQRADVMDFWGRPPYVEKDR